VKFQKFKRTKDKNKVDSFGPLLSMILIKGPPFFLQVVEALLIVLQL
jgi:hypothetical protein